MSFLAPLFLVGAAAAAVPVILHLLKREPEPRVKFTAVKLLKHAPVEYTEKRWLRELLLLALRIVALLLLAVGFARPFFRSSQSVAQSTVTVVALDTSYSLSSPGRFERAKQLAKDAVRQAPAGGLVSVVTFADQAEIAAKPSADRVLALSAIDQTTVGFGATRYRAAMSAAAQALNGGRGAIVVVTDLQESGWDAGDRVAVPEGAGISVVDVGELPANFAVTSVEAQRDRTIAVVHNASAKARDVRAHLTIDGRATGDVTVSLGPNQSAETVFAGAPRGAVAEVRVDDPTGVQADNVRYAVIGGSTGASVAVVGGSGDLSRDAFYVQHALAAGAVGSASGYKAVAMTGAQLSTARDDALAGHAAVLLLSTRGLERRGRESLAAFARRGGGILVAAGPDVDGEIVREVLGEASTLRIVAPPDKSDPRVLAPVDARHPVFTAFAGGAATLGLVKFQRAARIAGTGCQTLARFTSGDSALIECPAGEGRALVIASDLDNRWNDFPLHATFVPFLHEVVGYIASGRAHASEYVIADAPAGVRRSPGIATVDGRPVAVNVDPRESDPARLSAEEFQSAVTHLSDRPAAERRVEAMQEEDRQHLWQYVLALMIVTLAVEGFVASRTA